MYWNVFYLTIAIMFEVVATSALKMTNGFTNLLPSLVAVSGYALAFYFLSLTLRAMPVGVVYAIWCGAGIIFITTIGWVGFRQATIPYTRPARAAGDTKFSGWGLWNLAL